MSLTSASLKVFLRPCLLCLPLERRIPTVAALTLAKINKRSVGLVSCGVSDNRFFESVPSALSPVSPTKRCFESVPSALSPVSPTIASLKVFLRPCLLCLRQIASLKVFLRPCLLCLPLERRIPEVAALTLSKNKMRSVSLVFCCQDTESRRLNTSETSVSVRCSSS